MHTFTTPDPISAVLDIPAGRVQFIAADRSDTTVEIRPVDTGEGRDAQLAEQITVEYDDGVLRVAAPAGHKILGSSGAVEVTVQLPAGSQVTAQAASAGLRAVGRLGDVAFTGADGEIKVDEATAARLTTMNGNISVGRLHGPAEISTGKGDIRVTEAVRGTVVLTTQAGDVTIGAAPGASATLDAGTSYGRVQNALRNTEGAGAELAIRATTAYGDIVARSL